ncbi:MAG: ATP synthase F1 subunit epsilon [Elusimicrobiaceae bacterium]|nr:ATP synthase F1 subunit epsilon [Elusimicrobiaceae bacterium]
MPEKLKLIIVTPERKLDEREVDFVTIPASGGEMGVLPGHVPCVVTLAEGLLRYRTGGSEEAFAVMGGFAEVLDNEVSVFAESGELAAEISEEKERQAIARAKDILAAKEKDLDIEAVQTNLRRAALRIKLAQKSNPRQHK